MFGGIYTFSYYYLSIQKRAVRVSLTRFYQTNDITRIVLGKSTDIVSSTCLMYVYKNIINVIQSLNLMI